MTDTELKTIVYGAKKENLDPAFIQHLESMKFRIFIVESGPELVRQTALRIPDAVIIDVDVPKLNGYQSARLLRNDHSTQNIPIFHLAESATPIDQYWSRFCGGEALFSKPDAAFEFKIAMDELFHHHFPRKHRLLRDNILAELDDLSLTGLANGLLEKDLLHANILNEINLIDVAAISFTEMSAAIMAIVETLFEFTIGAVLRIDGTDGELLVWSNRQCDDATCEKIKRLTLDHLNRVHHYNLDAERIGLTLLKQGKGPLDPDLSNEISFHVADAPSFSSMVIFENLLPERLENREKEPFQTAMTLVHSMLDKKIQFQNAQRYSIIDNETNGFSHEFFMAMLAREIENASRNKYPLTVFTLVVSNVKTDKETDEFSEARKLHTILYKLILSVMRKSDIVARLEKTSYVFLLTHTNMDKAQIALDRITTHVQRSLDKLISSTEPVKIRSGIYQLDPRTDNSPEALMDKALPRL